MYLKSFIHDENGAPIIEYIGILIMAGLLLVAISGIASMAKKQANDTQTDISNAFTKIKGGAGTGEGTGTGEG